MHGRPQLGRNQTDHVSVHGELHLLRFDRIGKRQRCHIAPSDSAYYHSNHLRRHARQCSDDQPHAGVERVSAYSSGEVWLARRDDDRSANLGNEHFMDAIARGGQRRAECNERWRDDLL
ncbi:hypothetical protein SDC9_169526 [bioreactor metagenome]|uniref:Uncharacterized protein n=1 Tax=bioreactor metagenome TaxID=1076179 RepID=A0A645GEB8_9ZZZZ